MSSLPGSRQGIFGDALSVEKTPNFGSHRDQQQQQPSAGNHNESSESVRLKGHSHSQPKRLLAATFPSSRQDGRRSMSGPKGTSLYGVPSWWGEDDEDKEDEETNQSSTADPLFGKEKSVSMTSSETSDTLLSKTTEKRDFHAISGGSFPRIAWEKKQVETVSVLPPPFKLNLQEEYFPVKNVETFSPESSQDSLDDDTHCSKEGEPVSYNQFAEASPVSSASRPLSARRQWNKLQSYDHVVLSSILALSKKLRQCSEVAAQKVQTMRDAVKSVSRSYVPESRTVCDVPDWKSSDRETAAIIENLRYVEHYLEAIDEIAGSSVLDTDLERIN
eukprot:m.98617 g.98617  ORF g.98617 m.98617 type:complete len:332 (+) comp36992_c1_seq9:85-1080(+)